MLKVISDELPENFVCYFEASYIHKDVVSVTLQEGVHREDNIYFFLPIFVGDGVRRSVNILMDVFKCTFDNYDVLLPGAQWTALEAKLYDVLDSFKWREII